MEYINYIAEVLGWTAFHAVWQILLVCILLKLISFFISSDAYKSKLALFGSGALLIVLSSIATFIYIFDPSVFSDAQIGQIPPQYFMYETSADVTYHSGILEWLERHSQWMGMIWLLGSLGLFVYWGSGYFYLKRLQHQSTLIKGKWMEKIYAWSEKAGRKGNVKIALSTRIMSPVLTGILQPIILFPAGMWHAFDEDQIECILRHEWLHWKRYDHLINIALILFESIYFFHPLSWWLGKGIRHQQELIVDRETVGHTKQPIRYAKTLYEVQQMAINPQLGMTAFAGDKGKLLHRIERILSPARQTKTRIMNTQSIGIILTSLIFAVLASLGAYSMKGNTGTENHLQVNEDIQLASSILIDSTPNEEEIEIKDVKIRLDEDGNVKSVRTKSETQKKEIFIKYEKGKVKKEVEVKRILGNSEELDYETSETTITNEDGSKETIPQVIIRKPKREEVREVKVIKRGGQQSFNAPGTAEIDHYLQLSAQEIKRLTDRSNLGRASAYFEPSNDFQFHLEIDTTPSPENWDEFERKMREYSKRMAEWGQKYAQEMQKHMPHPDSLERMVEKMDIEGWSEEEEKAFKERMEAYGERLEAWGERLEEQMERWAEKYEKELEDIEEKSKHMKVPAIPPPPPPPPLPPADQEPPPPPPSPDGQ